MPADPILLKLYAEWARYKDVPVFHNLDGEERERWERIVDIARNEVRGEIVLALRDEMAHHATPQTESGLGQALDAVRAYNAKPPGDHVG